MDTNRKAIGERFRKALRRQGGFTLIELVAVMAILGILVAVVAPAVTNTQKASVSAQAQADSSQVRNAANDFFKDQEASEVTIPHEVDVTAGQVTALDSAGLTLTTDTIDSTQQRVSTRWPEVFISEGSSPPTLTTTRSADSRYAEVFPTSASDSTALVVSVTLFDDDELLVPIETLLADFTAIDLKQLVTEGFLSELPGAEDRVSDSGVLDTGGKAVEVPNFLWLFEKTDSSGGTDDAREISVFELVAISQNEISAGNTVNLVYEQIQ